MSSDTGRPKANATHTAMLVTGTAFVGFSAAHLIDEFLWNAPQEFHLREETTLVLALLFVTALAGLLAGAAMQRPTSTIGLAMIGALIAVADICKHAPEIIAAGPWRSGLVSTLLAAASPFSTWLPARSPGAWICPIALHPGASDVASLVICRPPHCRRGTQVDSTA